MPQNSITAVDKASLLVELVFVMTAKPDQLDSIVFGGLGSDYEVIELK